MLVAYMEICVFIQERAGQLLDNQGEIPFWENMCMYGMNGVKPKNDTTYRQHERFID